MERENEENGETLEAVEVRAAKSSDAAAIHALAGELAAVVGDEVPPEDDVRARLAELSGGKHSGVLVAEVSEPGREDSTVAGVISYWIKPDLAHGDRVAEVPMLAVAKNHRRNGVGKALLAAVSDIAADAGATLMELVVVPENTEARDFYRSLGFVETDHLVLEFVGEVEDFSEMSE